MSHTSLDPNSIVLTDSAERRRAPVDRTPSTGTSQSSDATSTGPATARDVWRPTHEERVAVSKALRAAHARITDAWYATQFDGERLRRYSIIGGDDLTREAALRSFIEPLFALLVEYAATGESRYHEIYVDERLRYAPHLADPTVRLAFFHEVLAADERVVMDATRASGQLAQDIRSLLLDVHSPLLDNAAATKAIRLVAVGDCLMADIRSFLSLRSRASGLRLDMRTLYFSAIVNRNLSTESVVRFIEKHPADLIGLSFLTYSALPLYPALLRAADSGDKTEYRGRMAALLSALQQSLEHLRAHTDAPFLLHNASGLPLTRWREHLPIPALSGRRQRMLAELNRGIAELAGSVPKTLIIDEAAVAHEKGLRACAAPALPRRITRNAFFHTNRLGEHLASRYHEVIRSFAELRRAKVLVLDFDNTLWQGVMADGPVTHFHERQRLLKRLKEGGMLLIAASKNDPASIRWDEMALTPADFVLLKIGWDLKAQSIHQAAQELDLGLDSFVFVDDNPVECDLVRRELPEVRTLDANDAMTWRSIERLLSFPNTRDTAEARARTELYQQQVSRREEMARGFDYAAMMGSLQLEVEFGRARAGDLGRLVELLQRTNQFNTTTIRYTREQLTGLLKRDDHRIYVAAMRDKFGDLGVVSSVIVRDAGEELMMDSFVMSCRAMGFELERLVMRLALDEEGRAKPMVGRFLPTDRNAPAMHLFSVSGFASRGNSEWLLAPHDPSPAAPEWFTVRKRT